MRVPCSDRNRRGGSVALGTLLLICTAALLAPVFSGNRALAVEPEKRGDCHQHVCGVRRSNICLSHDGSQILTASEEGCINLWDARTGTLRKTTHNCKGTGYAPYQRLVFSPDDSLALIGGPYGDVPMTRIWNVATGEQRCFLLGAFSTAAFTPDSAQVLTHGRHTARGDESDCRRLSLWDSKTGRLTRMFSGATAGVASIAFSKEEGWVLTGSRSGSVQLWNMVSGKEVKSFQISQDTVCSIAFLPGDSGIIAGLKGGTVVFLDIASGAKTRTLAMDECSNCPVAVAMDGKRLLTVGNKIAIWDIESEPKILLLFEPENEDEPPAAHKGTVLPVNTVKIKKLHEPNGALSADGKTVYLAANNGPIEVRDAESGALLRSLNDFPVEEPPQDEDPNLREEKAKQKRASTRQALDFLPRPMPVQLQGALTEPLWTAGTGGLSSNITLSPDGRMLLAGYDDGQARLFDAVDGHFLRRLTDCNLCADSTQINVVAFSDTGERALTLGGDRVAKVWDVARGTLLGVLTGTVKGDMPNFGAIALSPDGAKVLVMDEPPILWEVDSQRIVQLPEELGEGCCAVAFSPDGERAVSGAFNRAILWNVKTGEIIRTLQRSCHPSALNTVAFSRDGKSVLVGGYDDDPMVFDAESGGLIATFASPYMHGCSNSVLSPDGNRAMTCNQGGGVSFWSATTGVPVGDTSRSALYGDKDVKCGAFTLDGAAALLANRWGQVQVREIASGRSMRDPFWICQDTDWMCVDTGRQQILGGSQLTGRMLLLDAQTGAITGECVIPLEKHENCSALALRGDLAAAAITEKGATVWDAKTGRILQTLNAPLPFPDCLDISLDGERILFGRHDKSHGLSVWNRETNERLVSFRKLGTAWGTARFTSRGTRELTLKKDEGATLWDVDSDKVLWSFVPELGHLTACAISRSGTRVLVGSEAGISTVWDAETGFQVCHLAGHSNRVDRACISDDGVLAATCSGWPSRFGDGYGEVKIWDISSGSLIRNIRCQPGFFGGASFSGDNKSLFICNAGSVSKWPVFGTATPDVVGQKESVARKALAVAGVSVEVTEEPTVGVPPGLVLHQEPEPHTEVPEHDTVRLVVSKRPNRAAKP